MAQVIEIIEADTPTVNKHVYPLPLLEKIAQDAPDLLLGRVNDRVGTDPTTILLSDAAFVVRNLRVENAKLIGDMELVDTPRGRDFEPIASLVRYAPAGIGYVNDEGVIDEDDYQLLCVDAILDDENGQNITG